MCPSISLSITENYCYRRMYMSVNRTREVLSFELGKEIEEDVFRLVTNMEHEESNLRLSDSAPRCSITH